MVLILKVFCRDNDVKFFCFCIVSYNNNKRIPILCMCSGETYEYAIAFHRSEGKKSQTNTISLGILNMVLPTIVTIYICLSPINQYHLNWSRSNMNSRIFDLFDNKCETKKERNKDSPRIIRFRSPPLHRK